MKLSVHDVLTASCVCVRVDEWRKGREDGRTDGRTKEFIN
jgi:hypothetical protein